MLRWGARTAGLCVAAWMLAQSCCAQANAPTAQDDKSTLHVYVNLVQIPVLVLNSSLHATPRIPDSNFKVSLEGLGQIHPSRIRLEGEDPINLTLIVDRSEKDDTLWNDLPKSMERLIQSLRPRDHISFLAFDGCTARRFGPEMAPFDAEWMKQTAKVLTNMAPSKLRGKQDCPKPITYWELVMYAANKLSQYPGRKILVTLGPGDTLTRQTAEQVHTLLTQHSITLFPIVHPLAMRTGMSSVIGRSGNQPQFMSVTNPALSADALLAMTTEAELSGGMLLPTTYQQFSKTLAQPVELARGRYIIEFPRPDKLPPGTHYIQVEDGHPHDFIRIAGISVPIAAPNELKDPTVQHGPLMASGASAADSSATLHDSEQDSDDEKPPASVAPLTPAAPVALPAITSAPAPVAADVVKPVAAKSPQADPADITDDLRPQR